MVGTAFVVIQGVEYGAGISRGARAAIFSNQRNKGARKYVDYKYCMLMPEEV